MTNSRQPIPRKKKICYFPSFSAKDNEKGRSYYYAYMAA